MDVNSHIKYFEDRFKQAKDVIKIAELEKFKQRLNNGEKIMFKYAVNNVEPGSDNPDALMQLFITDFATVLLAGGLSNKLEIRYFNFALPNYFNIILKSYVHETINRVATVDYTKLMEIMPFITTHDSIIMHYYRVTKQQDSSWHEFLMKILNVDEIYREMNGKLQKENEKLQKENEELRAEVIKISKRNKLYEECYNVALEEEKLVKKKRKLHTALLDA